MILTALLAGAAAGLALLLARLLAEEEPYRVYMYEWGYALVDTGRRPMDRGLRPVLHYFIAAGTAADVYAAYFIAAGPAQTAWSIAALALIALSLTAIVHAAVRPGVGDLEAALLACAPHVYLFALYIASRILGWPSIWPPPY